MSEPYSLPTEPEGVAASLLERFGSGKVSMMMALYEPDAGDIAELVLDWSIDGTVPTVRTCTSEARRAMLCAAARTESGGT